MARGLPSTDALRSFASAARAGSFKRAAVELHLSASALSRQIQGLERHLGVALFRRLNPGIELTDEGRRYLDQVEEVLARLADAQEQLLPQRPLRISALESFSESWLVPRLGEFERAHPDVELELEATLRYADFARDPVDAAIRFGRGPWEGLHAEPLLELAFFPVASAELCAGEPALRAPADLAQHTQIHVAQTPGAWAAWLAAAGVSELQPRRSVTYDHVGLALAAAEAAQGVALSTPLLCGRRLEEQRLVRPFALEVRSAETYHFVCRPEERDEWRIAAFREWLRTQLSDAFGATADVK